jgi:hypothetical protein
MKIAFRTTRLALALATIARMHKNRSMQLMVPICSAFVTYSTVSGQHVTNMVVAIGSTIILFLCVSVILYCMGLIGSLIAGAFLKKAGSICVHSLSLEESGLLESTEVNQSLHYYHDVGRAYKRFGVWIFPAGLGVFVFRESDVLEGNLSGFIASLNERQKA